MGAHAEGEAGAGTLPQAAACRGLIAIVTGQRVLHQTHVPYIAWRLALAGVAANSRVARMYKTAGNAAAVPAWLKGHDDCCLPLRATST
jgi:hypothetical protein